MIQIFLSYAREDYAVVRRLYDRLRDAGYKPWMDKVDLPKGADFAKAIPKVLRESDLFIVCLSQNSVEKRSFIQREINLALDAWEQKLDDDLYIFPVRLEACKAPDRISKFNWTDLFGDEEEDEWNALLQALRTQAGRLGKTPSLVSEVKPAKTLPPIEDLHGVLEEWEALLQILRAQIERLGKAPTSSPSPMPSPSFDNASLEDDLRRALQRDEFRIFYQPIFLTETRELVGFESLVRWNHPEQGWLLPAHFTPIAEATELIISLDRQILHNSCKQIWDWQQEFSINSSLFVSVNLSGKTFIHPGLHNDVHNLLDKMGRIPIDLVLEITESLLVEDQEIAVRILRQLKDIGVRLLVDDFGTGFSSFSFLHRLPIDMLKIDRSFVTQMGISESLEIIRTIIVLAANLGLKVIAEGVENREQRDVLANLHCDYVQGEWFSKPMSAAGVHKLLRQTYPKR